MKQVMGIAVQGETDGTVTGVLEANRNMDTVNRTGEASEEEPGNASDEEPGEASHEEPGEASQVKSWDGWTEGGEN